MMSGSYTHWNFNFFTGVLDFLFYCDYLVLKVCDLSRDSSTRCLLFMRFSNSLFGEKLSSGTSSSSSNSVAILLCQEHTLSAATGF